MALSMIGYLARIVIALVEKGELNIRMGPRVTFSELQQAHTLMDENRANGKIVVTLDP